MNGCGGSLRVWGEDRDLGEHVGGWKLKIRLSKTAAAETQAEEWWGGVWTAGLGESVCRNHAYLSF